MTKDTAAFLLGLVNGLQLNVGAPDFDAALASVMQARVDLRAILSEESAIPEQH